MRIRSACLTVEPDTAALREVMAHARRRGLLVLLDAKRGDIGVTAEHLPPSIAYRTNRTNARQVWHYKA